MTKEQIIEFDRFLKIRDIHKLYYDTLKKCPIEHAYASKEVYLPRVPSALALSYGFYQTRLINNIKESEWTILRNEWIDYAYKSGALDSCLDGILPINIISAINSVFNGKQFRGVLRTSDQVLEKISIEAKQIQEIRAKQTKIEEENEEVKLRQILDQTPPILPEIKFNKVALDARITIAKRRFFNSDEANHANKLMRKKTGAITNSLNGNNLSDLFDYMNDLVDLYEAYKKCHDEFVANETEKFEEDKKQYEIQYQEQIKEREQAEQRLAELKKIQYLNQLAESEQQQDPEPGDTTPEPDQVVTLNIRKNNPNSKVTVRDNQIYMVKCKIYNTSFGSNIDKLIFERNLKMFDLVISSGHLCLRFNNTGANELSVRNYRNSTKLAIFSKHLIEYVQSYYKVPYEKLLANVEVSCTPDSVTCKIISIKEAKGS